MRAIHPSHLEPTSDKEESHFKQVLLQAPEAALDAKNTGSSSGEMNFCWTAPASHCPFQLALELQNLSPSLQFKAIAVHFCECIKNRQTEIQFHNPLVTIKIPERFTPLLPFSPSSVVKLNVLTSGKIFFIVILTTVTPTFRKHKGKGSK